MSHPLAAPVTASLIDTHEGVTPGATPSAPALRRGRALHLIDLDNQLNTASPTPGATAAWWRSYERLVGREDAIVVASSHHSAIRSWWELPVGRMQLLVRSGADGADAALTDSFDLAHTAARFDYLVLASEDHYFVPLLQAAEQAGLTTWLVTSERPAARTLARVARLHSRVRSNPVGRVAPVPSIRVAATLAA